MARYAVANCDNTEECDTLERACRVAEEWFPEGWDVRLDPREGLDVINTRLRSAYGPGDHHEPDCPEIRRLPDPGVD